MEALMAVLTQSLTERYIGVPQSRKLYEQAKTIFPPASRMMPIHGPFDLCRSAQGRTNGTSMP